MSVKYTVIWFMFLLFVDKFCKTLLHENREQKKND